MALIGSVVIVLPVSTIFHEAEGHSFSGSPNFHSCTSGVTAGRAGTLPAKSCPVLELRAGLALFSLKPTSRVTVDLLSITVSANATPVLSSLHGIVSHSNIRQSDPDLSIIRVLRI